jgi:hypothetical protein
LPTPKLQSGLFVYGVKDLMPLSLSALVNILNLYDLPIPDTTSISVMRESDPIYCIELPQLKDSSQESTYILLTWVNVLLVEDHCSR